MAAVKRATVMGSKAAALVRSPRLTGTLLAVVTGAVYLQTEDGDLIWLAEPSSPLHRCCILVPLGDSLLRPGMHFEAAQGILTLAGRVHIHAHNTPIWLAESVQIGQSTPPLGSLFELASTASTGGAGLASFIPQITGAFGRDTSFPTRLENALVRRAAAAVERIIRACLDENLEESIRSGEDLLGLGPGLTPSGDDFMGGFLFTAWHLRAFGLFQWPEHAINRLLARARILTNAISYAILADLAQGHGPEPLHHFLSTVLTGTDSGAAWASTAALRHIGHSSGWDMLTGALTGLLLAAPVILSV